MLLAFRPVLYCCSILPSSVCGVTVSSKVRSTGCGCKGHNGVCASAALTRPGADGVSSTKWLNNRGRLAVTMSNRARFKKRQQGQRDMDQRSEGRGGDGKGCILALGCGAPLQSDRFALVCPVLRASWHVARSVLQRPHNPGS